MTSYRNIPITVPAAALAMVLKLAEEAEATNEFYVTSLHMVREALREAQTA
jgi:hypothetical protein